MRGTGRGITRERFSLVKTLVVGQVALSLVLLVGAGLLLGSFVKQFTIDPGFRPEGVLLVRADIRRLGLDPVGRADLYSNMLGRLATTPGVRSASSVDIVPLGNSGWNNMIHVDGFTPKNDRDAILYFNSVSAAYFETIGTPMLAGRDFAPSDRRGSSPVAIVNESMAKKFFHGANPIGKSFSIDQHGTPGEAYQIVGLVKDTKYRNIRETNSESIFLAATQNAETRNSVNFALRTNGPTAAVVPAVRSAIAKVNPLIAFDFSTLGEVVGNSLARPRLIAQLSIFFGALALLLAVIGLYGTMSYSVERRRSEIGIRIALGAARARVLSMVIREAGWMVGAGIVVGIALAVGATRWVSSLLYGVTPTDAPTFALAGVALAAVALGASAIPAWRASRLDPMEALREE